ncbi:hypothetical protein EJ08DRAFT_694106 [Tothia fuscella]|uniref:Uncharacterized protein n=1 Tax=Tothia fuscella TaxID=1048955 RepID=A0A9P4NZS4_9PEZI|nr:hypothetical protein EJ08DRAFT_694106 [Tothia fuscella]
MSSSPTNNKVQTSDLPRRLTPTTPLPPTIHTHLTHLLLSHPTSTTTLENTLSEALSTTGWTTNLRTHIQNLIRSGECSTFDECLRRVMGDISVEKVGKEGNGVNGSGNGKGGVGGEVDLKIKESVVREGVGVVRRELERVCVVVVDD